MASTSEVRTGRPRQPLSGPIMDLTLVPILVKGRAMLEGSSRPSRRDSPACLRHNARGALRLIAQLSVQTRRPTSASVTRVSESPNAQ